MHDIEFDLDALEDLASHRRFQQNRVLDGIEIQLRYDPDVATRNRKRFRPNEIAEWELCVGQLRVFYNVHPAELIVRIEAVGIKVGNLLFIRGAKRQL